MNGVRPLNYRKGLRMRLIAAFIGIGILPFLVAGIYLSWQSFVVQRNQITGQQSAITRLASQSISGYLHEQVHLVEAYARANFGTRLERGSLRAKLREFLTVSRDEKHGYIFSAAYLINANGKELSHISRTRIMTEDNLLDLSNADEFTVPFYAKINYFSSVYIDALSGEPLMKVAYPIIDKKTAKVTGVFVAEMKFKPIWNVIAQLSIGEYANASLVDHNGFILAHKNPSVVLRNIKLPLWNEVGVISKSSDRQVIQTVDEVQYGGPPLYMVIEVPVERAYMHLYKEFAVTVVFFAVALLGAVAVGFFVLRQIIVPIEEMSVTALEIAQGDYSKKAKHTNDDELGDFASAFNTMTGNLVGAIRRIENEKEFIQSAIEALAHPFVVIDVKDHSVVLQNGAAKKYRVDGKDSCYAMIHGLEEPCNGDNIQGPISAVIETKAPVTIERICGEEIGKTRCYEVNAYPLLNEKNEVVQVIQYVIDITEKKALEVQLRQAKKLEALGHLAGGVAHDFNNLLTGIIGYAELTLNKLPVDSSLRRGVETILESGERGADLTGQLLTFSRQQALDFKIVSLAGVIDACSKIVRNKSGDDISLNMIVDGDLWNINADAGQINQLVMNLLVNACDAMPNGGVLTVTASNVVLNDGAGRSDGELLAGPYVKIIITDTGVGVSPDIRERMFDPFFTTKGEYGIGLGLAIVYGVVKQHDGSIHIESEVGKGTRFTLLLPATEDATEDEVGMESAGLAQGDEVVLVVDSDLRILRVIEEVLQEHGYSVYSASSSEEALDKCAELNGEIDLLFTDVAMPGMNGKELADAIVQQYSSVKVLFMSGDQEQVLVNCKINKERDALVRKPVRVESILSSVRSVLDAVDGAT